MDFQKRYNKLNAEQRSAVDAIEGPVMVIAGPGTGKTELLGVRVANILQKTDTLPENILCLTFTESGANTMRERLTDIIGKDAYKVAVHTFHSFGSEIINQYGQYFYEGAHFRPADDLSSYQILTDIFKTLKHNNPIAKINNDEYTYLYETKKVISELKKSGLTSDELLSILDENDKAIEAIQNLLSPILACGIKKNTAELCLAHVNTIRNIDEKIVIPSIIKLSTAVADSLQNAIDDASESNSTKPMTAWKNKWFQKDQSGNLILKSQETQKKLRAVSEVYESYLLQMQAAELYDFDDMILRVVHAMEIFNDLRLNLQEKYQYIMVDEFQDTNLAQMRILHNLTNNIASEGSPNIMVVGDDDQAIYSFQGADISNIIDFQKTFPGAQIITLTENYRSTAKILSGSREVIVQGKQRLENILESIDKNLNSHSEPEQNFAKIISASSILDERMWAANEIKALIKSGKTPCDIAVLLRQHKEINELLPYLYSKGIAVNYERHSNVLDQPPVLLIEQISRLLINISIGNHDVVNSSLPQILAHVAWGFSAFDIWETSLQAHKNHKQWLEIMAEKPIFECLFNWLIDCAKMIEQKPLEEMLDIIVGKPNNDIDSDKFISPIYDYYFSSEKLALNPTEYITHLDALRTIRSKLREYQPSQVPTLISFIDFISLNRKIGNVINSNKKILQTDNAINVMTAHKSKGLEFDTVFVMNAVDNVWGEKARGHNRLINYPENLPLADAGDSDDERLRLFYVAITRAKNNLNISYSDSDENGKQTFLASFLLNSQWDKIVIKPSKNIDSAAATTEVSWYQPLICPVKQNMRDLLAHELENYKLSVTHLANFLDVTSGGPQGFLINNLLHFPSAKSPNAAFGTAIHETMQQAHDFYAANNKKLSLTQLAEIFKKALISQHLSKPDFEHYFQKGKDTIDAYFTKNYDTFSQSQKTELNFSNQQCMLGDTHLTGKLDLVDIAKASDTISVTDYKTGKPASNWSGKDEHEKIKLHKYKQQLMFYKLLIEKSRDYHELKVEKAIMQFVEPTTQGEILSLSTDFSDYDMANFEKLIVSVYKHIKTLDLPDISKYDKSFNGILEFEADLINKDNKL